MADDEFTKQIDEMLKQHTLSVLYRIERLEEQNGLRDPASARQRLPPLETHADREIAKQQIIARLEVLEDIYGE